MLKKVREFPYILPTVFSSALIALLTQVCKCDFHSYLHTCFPSEWNALMHILICFPLHWHSFCARIQWTASVIWRVSGCRPSFVAPHSTRTSSKRRLLNSSWSSGLILSGRPKQWEAFQWTILITLTAIKFFTLLQLHPNCLLLWSTWSWAELRSRCVKFKTGLHSRDSEGTFLLRFLSFSSLFLAADWFSHWGFSESYSHMVWLLLSRSESESIKKVDMLSQLQLLPRG